MAASEDRTALIASRPAPACYRPDAVALVAAVLVCRTLLQGPLTAGEPPRAPVERPLTPAQRNHWAFQKPVRSEAPLVRGADWVRTPIDAFVLARLEKSGLTPSPPADRATLLRRVSYDLTGLPPRPDEIESFLKDERPDAYDRVVERLLGSPHHGEKWAQHWLDVARYAESNGYEADAERPHAWRYRDYVIQALNEDKRYDRFISEQLAGDEIAGARDRRENVALLVATGFNRCGQVHLVAGNTDPEVNRQEVLTEMTGAVGSAFLGLTIGCARCHDHKFDPVSQADYYRLQAFFAAVQPQEIDVSTAEERSAYDRHVQALNDPLTPLRKRVTDLEEPYKSLLTQLKRATLERKYQEALDVEPAKRTPDQRQLAEHAQVLIKVTWDEIVEALTPAEREQRAKWRARIHALEAHMPPPPPHAWAVADEARIPPTYVLKRGDVQRKGAEVQPGFPRVLENRHVNAQERLNRLALARWLTNPDHPLTARVMVNRIWQHHFGRGIVATPNDFGFRGEAPTHKELLDWLACEFVSHGWSIKHLHRLMVLSSTYRQASRVAPSTRARLVDPDNRLLWRMNRRRLTGEELRDGILAAAGTLNPELGGPMVRVPLEPEVYELIFSEGEPDGLWHVTPDPRQHTRRTVYLFAKRNLRLPLLEAFDRPDTLTSCPVRPVSTFAPQGLIMMNGPFVQTQSKAFAARLLRECGWDPDRQVRRAYRLAIGRAPRAGEMTMAREFLAGQVNLIGARFRAGLPPPGSIDPPAAAALADFCLALLNRNEFLYVN